MIKFFIVATLVLLNGIIYYAYKYRSEPNYKETLKSICKIFAIYLLIGVLMIMYKAEIKNYVKSARKENAISAEQSETKSYGTEKMIYASEQRSCSCAVNTEYIDTMAELVEMKETTKAAILYNVLTKEGKMLIVRSNTKVACYYSEAYRGFIPVIFMEGEYKGRRAYVPSNRLGEINKSI